MLGLLRSPGRLGSEVVGKRWNARAVARFPHAATRSVEGALPPPQAAIGGKRAVRRAYVRAQPVPSGRSSSTTPAAREFEEREEDSELGRRLLRFQGMLIDERVDHSGIVEERCDRSVEIVVHRGEKPLAEGLSLVARGGAGPLIPAGKLVERPARHPLRAGEEWLEGLRHPRALAERLLAEVDRAAVARGG